MSAGLRCPALPSHAGKDEQILARRHQVYQEAKRRHPERWSGKTRNWSAVKEVALNKINTGKQDTNEFAESGIIVKLRPNHILRILTVYQPIGKEGGVR